jgi:hypothetical protein
VGERKILIWRGSWRPASLLGSLRGKNNLTFYDYGRTSRQKEFLQILSTKILPKNKTKTMSCTELEWMLVCVYTRVTVVGGAMDSGVFNPLTSSALEPGALEMMVHPTPQVTCSSSDLELDVLEAWWPVMDGFIGGWGSGRKSDVPWRGCWDGSCSPFSLFCFPAPWGERAAPLCAPHHDTLSHHNPKQHTLSRTSHWKHHYQVRVMNKNFKYGPQTRNAWGSNQLVAGSWAYSFMKGGAYLSLHHCIPH